jgi:hypothetical protein
VHSLPLLAEAADHETLTGQNGIPRGEWENKRAFALFAEEVLGFDADERPLRGEISFSAEILRKI